MNAFPFRCRSLATGLWGAAMLVSPLLGMDAPESKATLATTRKPPLERVSILENASGQVLRLRTETSGLRLILHDTPEREARVVDDPSVCFLRPGDRCTLFVTPEFLAADGTFRVLRPVLKEEPSVAMGFRKVGDGLGFGELGDIRVCFQNPAGWKPGASPWAEDATLAAGTWGVFHLDKYLVRIQNPKEGGDFAGSQAGAEAAPEAGSREEHKGAGAGASSLPAAAGKAGDVLDRQCAAVKQTVAAWRKAKPEEPIHLVLGAHGWQWPRFGEGQWIFLDSMGEHFMNPVTGRGALGADGKSTVPYLTANFNNLSDLSRVAEALAGELDLLCLDNNVCKWTSWEKDHLDAFRRMLRPGGCLQIPIYEWSKYAHRTWKTPQALSSGAGAADPKDPDLLKAILEQSFPKVVRTSVRPGYLLNHRWFTEANTDHFVCEAPRE